MEPQPDFSFYPVGNFYSEGRAKIKEFAHEEGSEWADGDWFDGIIREHDAVKNRGRDAFEKLAAPYGDTFTDDREEAQLIYVSEFAISYQEKWNNQRATNRFWRDSDHIHVEKKEVKGDLVQFTLHLFDYMYLKKKTPHLRITFNQKGEFISVEEIDK